MKRLLQAVVLIIAPLLSLEAQNVNPKYYNNINQVGKIEANNSKIDIKRADQVLVRIDLTDKPKLLLTGYFQEKQGDSIYVTGITITDTTQILSPVNLVFTFDKPVLGSQIDLPRTGSAQSALSTFFSDDRTKAQFIGNITLTRGAVFLFGSKEKITVKVDGIAGVLKP